MGVGNRGLRGALLLNVSSQIGPGPPVIGKNKLNFILDLFL